MNRQGRIMDAVSTAIDRNDETGRLDEHGAAIH